MITICHEFAVQMLTEIRNLIKVSYALYHQMSLALYLLARLKPQTIMLIFIIFSTAQGKLVPQHLQPQGQSFPNSQASLVQQAIVQQSIQSAPWQQPPQVKGFLFQNFSSLQLCY